jgi:hypothetical protein
MGYPAQYRTYSYVIVHSSTEYILKPLKYLILETDGIISFCVTNWAEVQHSNEANLCSIGHSKLSGRASDSHICPFPKKRSLYIDSHYSKELINKLPTST